MENYNQDPETVIAQLNEKNSKLVKEIQEMRARESTTLKIIGQLKNHLKQNTEEPIYADIEYANLFVDNINKAPLKAYQKLKDIVPECLDIWKREYNYSFDDDQNVQNMKDSYYVAVTQFIKDKEA
ncbi:hypothetical protein [Vibrio parahaemolyticus]|uniref:hypothetical protein n=2 Tax=Vibrio parahaemolyticus TaxID=670 RepID=UPI0011219847|nr:hypothetical protein [Vibrio parahaemolyticus]MBE5175876.1 hypothetical protein [Vibrio parahaemolyticus]TOJ29442.1 hypothetical protein CGI43_07560 [Vibrio parahaemolyticus]TOJ91145.1 hypothetical protein CGI30_06070 [Vibrio parahaemolyticus]HCE4545004.1 hypothetical protein [Vibrio parahaemolyticus]HCG6276352.1 hypothetical protein [Vibrio parahaemolyticus]